VPIVVRYPLHLHQMTPELLLPMVQGMSYYE
jgi:hypothetical protein